MSNFSGTDVLVVGGGPAGSVTSILLARRGWRVTLLDRSEFPRPKACGETLNPGAVRLLHQYGLLDAVMDLNPSRIEGWSIGILRGAAFDATYSHRDLKATEIASTALGISRTALDATLLGEAAAAGVSVRERLHVRSLDDDLNCEFVTVGVRPHGAKHDTTFSARFVVGADGLRSRIAREIQALGRLNHSRKLSLSIRVEGSGPNRDRGILRVGDRLTVGLAPVHRFDALWNATIVVDPLRCGLTVRRDMKSFILAKLLSAGIGWDSEPIFLGETLASGPFDQPVRWAARNRVVLVGDAAGYYDPLTGQGIYRALRGASIAATHLDQLLRGESPRDQGSTAEPSSCSDSTAAAAAAATYSAALTAEFGSGRRLQRAINASLRHTAISGGTFRILRNTPRAASWLLRLIGDMGPMPRVLNLAPTHHHTSQSWSTHAHR